MGVAEAPAAGVRAGRELGQGPGVALGAVRNSMPDFEQYMRVEVSPGGWYRDADAPASK